MKNVLTAIIIGMFALTSHLTAGNISSANSNDLDNNPKIEIQLDRIEYLSNELSTGTFRLKLHAGSLEIYNDIIDFSASSRITSTEIPTSRIGNLDISGAELVITLESVESGVSTSQNIGSLEVSRTFEATLYVPQSNRNVGILVQGGIRIE